MNELTQVPSTTATYSTISDYNGPSADASYRTICVRPVASGPILPCCRERYLSVTPWRKFLLCAFLMAVAWVLTDTVTAIITDFLPPTPPLPDVWFALFDENPMLINVSEVIMALSAFAAITVALANPFRWLILARVFYLSSLLYLARAVCMSVTLLPNQSKNYECPVPMNRTSIFVILQRIRTRLLSIGTEVLGNSGLKSCGDLLFSGHTIVLVLACFVIKEYGPRHYAWISRICDVAVAIAVACILTSRMHYTIDCILAYYFTSRVFWAYHDYARFLHGSENGLPPLDEYIASGNSSSLRNPNGPSSQVVKTIPYGSDLISRVFWYPLVHFIELS